MSEENKNKWKEFADEIHMEIHAVRRIPNYKASLMEKNISKLVIKNFNDCKECQEIKKKIQETPEQEGFQNKLSKMLGG